MTMLLTLWGNILATDKLYIEDFRIKPGEKMIVDILLNNPEAEYRDLQFDLYLPEGIIWVQDEYGDFICENSARCTSNHSNAVSPIETNHYRCVLNSMKKAPLSGNSGAILTITLQASDNIIADTYKGYFRNVSLSKADATGPTYEEFSFDITVKSEEQTPLAKSGICKQYFGGDAIWTYDETSKILTIRPHNGEEITQPSLDILSSINVKASDGSVNKLSSGTNWTYTKGVQKSFETHTGSYNNQQNYSYVDFVPTSGNITVGFNVPSTLSDKYDIYLVTCPIWLKDDYENIPVDEWDGRPYRFTASIIERESEGKNAGNFPTKGTALVNPNPIEGLSNTIFLSKGMIYNDDGSIFVNDTTYLGEYEFKDTYDGGDYGVIIQIASSVLSSQRINFSNEMLISSIILKPHDNDTPLDTSIQEKVEHVVVEDGIPKIDYAFDGHGFHNIKTIDIPNSVNSISNGAFLNCSGLSSVALPNGVPSIGAFTFSGCTSLTSVTIPNGITSIGESAFANCGGLTSVIIPDGVTSIGTSAFSGCAGLTAVSFPNGVASIGESAFANCGGLTSVTIPNSVTSIGASAFKDCVGVNSVTIGNGVTSIGKSAFEGCNDLVSVKVPVTDLSTFCNNKVIGQIRTSIAKPVSLIDNNGKEIKDYVIPNEVTTIGECAFGNCTSLTSVSIPNGVETIGNLAFYGCGGLTSLDIPNTVISIGGSAFNGCNLTSVVIPSSVTSIGYSCFEGLTSVTINSNTIISQSYKPAIIEGTTRGLYHIIGDVKECILGEDIKSIGAMAFYRSTSLTSITIPSSVTSIEYGAFAGCINLPSITIPESVTTIGERMFYNCHSLVSIVLPENLTTISNEMFYHCENLASVKIPEKVKKIGASAFNGCNALPSVTIPNSVKTIDEWAFADCNSLTSVYIPNNVTDISLRAFWGCKGLTSIVVDEANKIYDSRNGCNAIIRTGTNRLIAGCQNTIIPNGVKKIDDNALGFCGMTSVIIPQSVTYIGDYAFSSCTNLTDFYCLAKDVPETSTYGSPFNKWASEDPSVKLNNITLHVPAESIDSYKAKEPWSKFGSIIALTEAQLVDDKCIDGIYYNFDAENKTAEVISSPNSYSGDINIPDAVIYKDVEYRVTKIGIAAFTDCCDLISVTIPNSVVSISKYAFSGCNGLSSVSMPNSIEYIGNQAFYACNGLTSITIPNGITSISDRAFCDCRNLSSVTIPNSVSYIGVYAFNGCGLTNVHCYATDVPEAYGSFDVLEAYGSFHNVTDAILHVPAESIDAYKAKEPWSKFGSIIALTEEPINVEDNYIDGVYYSFDVENQTAGVTSGENNYTGEVIIPSSITYNDVTYFVTTIGAESFIDCSGLTSVTIPESVTSIGGYAFMNCSNLTSVSIPESVRSIEAGAFNCCGLTSVNIPYGVTNIGHNTFSCCYNLTSVTIPESVTSIDDYAFSWCNSLTSISIPSSIISLGEGIFYGCSGLKDVYCYAESVPETGAEMFNSVELENATLHVSATSIDTYKETEPWKNFGNIVALPEIVPMEEDTEVTFDEIITAETDLTDVVIDNVYVTLDTEGDDGYDMEEKCIVLVSIVTDEQIETITDKEVKDETVRENYNGLIFAIPAGKGFISITAKTRGNRAMSVKIGDAEAQTFVQPELGVVEIPYTSDKDTYVYVYGAGTSVSAKRRVSSADTENSVLIYSVKWTAEEPTGLDTVVLTHDDAFQIFTPDGKQIETLQKGVNIIKYKNGGTQKIHVK